MKNIVEKPLLNNDRLDFSKISGKLPLPYLVEIQTDSYKHLMDEGIDEVFNDVFPIYNNYSESMRLEYVSHEFEPAKYSFLECKERDLNYSAPLRVTLRLVLPSGEYKEGKVFMGEFPLMTDSGTFIISGVERVIVSQIVRSPGAYLSKDLEKTGIYRYEADLIPARGTWLQFESDSKNLLNVRIDRQRKMFASILLKALGMEKDEDIVEIFGDHPMLINTLSKDKQTDSKLKALTEIFQKLKPGEPVTVEGVKNFLFQKFFDEKRYDLGNAGRYKYRRKLGIYNRLVGRILAENLVDADGVLTFKSGHLMSLSDVNDLRDKRFFETGAHQFVLPNNPDLDNNSIVNIVKVYTDDTKKRVVNIVGTDLNLESKHVTTSDIYATFSYFMNVIEGFGDTDDIDHLSNRRVRCVGELIQQQIRIGLTKMAKAVQQRMSIADVDTITPASLINIRPLTAAIREFFASSQLSQFMDQTNPLAELTNKRRISALGPGGLTRDRASMEVRDVHYTHYGRICPIETPEGQNIGLINNLATYAKVNKYGFIETPYRRVDKKKHVVTEENVYLSADKERNVIIAQANVHLDPVTHEILDELVIARHNGENIVARREDVDYIDVSPKQIVSVASACIPFLENDDTMRALMGANMQRQALPLLRPHAPYVGTGLEHLIARDSGLAVVATGDGKVTYVDCKTIKVKEPKVKEQRVYTLQKFDRSNQGTCINQVPVVKVGDEIKRGQIIADGPAMEHGDLALGQNVTIAFMMWNGYNYEDAVIMSEKLVKDDAYTSIHIEKYEIECRSTKIGDERITRDLPNVNEDAKAFLDERGIIIPGSKVKEGDILVGKTTPKGASDPTPEEKLLQAIFADKTNDQRESSLRVPHGGAGIVLDVKIFSRKNKDQLPAGVNEVVRVYIAQKRKISEGDKMSGRHGNKGVISRILPVEDMPFLPDGTPVDIMLNPLGVPSRMNIGQILEIHLGMACKKLSEKYGKPFKIATPVFDGISNEEIFKLMEEAQISKDGKTVLYDGRTGERFDERISVGVMYMIKLVHMVDDKLHARATGPYSLVTQQPLGGKAQNGGQRFGEMEVWALEAYGAAHTLQEILTIKSDDRIGRRKAYEAIITNKELPEPGIPEAFKVLTKELQGLGMDVKLLNHNGEEIDLEAIAREAQKEERHSRKNAREEEIEEEYVPDEELSTRSDRELE